MNNAQIGRYAPLSLLLGLCSLVGYWSVISPAPKAQPAEAQSVQPSGVVDSSPAQTLTAALRVALAAPASDPGLLRRLVLDRAVQMQRLMQTSPQEALAVALTTAERAALPASVQDAVELPFSQNAKWSRFSQCSPGAEPLGAVEFAGNSYYVRPTGKWAEAFSKNAVPVSGILLGSWAALHQQPAQPVPGKPQTYEIGGKLYSFSQQTELARLQVAMDAADALPDPAVHSGKVLAAWSADRSVDLTRASVGGVQAASAWTETPKRILLIPVDFSDAVGDPVDLGALSTVMNGTVKSSVESFSYSKTTTITTIRGRVRVAEPRSGYLPSNTSKLLTHAKNAATAAGSVLGNFDIVGVVFTNIGMTSGGSFAGLASIGAGDLWLQGSTNAGVIVHELGHNYGLGHSNFWQTTNGTVVGTGASLEYGDLYDLMGSAALPLGHFNSQAKALLNWVPATDAALVNTSGTYRLFRIDHPGAITGRRGIKLTKSGGDAYWISYRGAETRSSIRRGVTMNWERGTTKQTWLMDAAPETSTTRDGLTLGRTYSDTASQLHVTPLALGGSAGDGSSEYIDVAVNIGAFAGNAAPTGSIAGPSAVTARNAVLYTANFTDANNDTLSYSWDFGDGTVFPDAARVSKSWAVGGAYTVKVTASDRKGGTQQATLNVTASDPATSWTTRTSNTAGDLKDIAASSSAVVAVGGDNTVHPALVSSADGITWTSRSVPSGLNVYLRSIVWTGTQFVAVGQDYSFALSTFVSVIFTSPTGVTWTRAFTGSTVAAKPLEKVTFGNGLHVAVGENGTVLTSPDGASWTVRSAGTSNRLASVTYLAPYFHTVGHATSPSYNGSTTSFRSTDGITWTNLSSAVTIEPWRDFRSIANLNGSLLTSGWYGGLNRSTDAATSWTALQPELDLPGFAYGNGVYLAVGLRNVSGSFADRDLLATGATVGQSWTETDPGSLPDREAAVFFNNTFLTVGAAGAIRQTAAFTAPTGFSNWAATAFPAGTSSALQAATADADNDGFPNLVEYAAGTSPSSPNQRPSVQAVRSGANLILEFNTPTPRPADLIVEAQTTTNGSTWGNTGFTVLTNTSTSYRVAVPTTGSSRRLARIQIIGGAEP
jgi:hypothetical protein